MSDESAEQQPHPGGASGWQWDDALFRDRVATLAARKGISVGAACKSAGLSRDYVKSNEPADGRNIERILKLANFFDVDPVWLMGFERGSAAHPEAASSSASTVINEQRRLAIVGDIAAHLYTALAGRDDRTQDVSKLVSAIVGLLHSPK